MMEYTTPPSYGSTIVNVGGIATDGEILCAGSRGNSVEHTKTKKDSANDWTEPEAIKFVWGGSTKDGKKVSARIEGSLGKRLDKVDVMEKVPGFIKTIVGGVAGTKPYIYQACYSLSWHKNNHRCLTASNSIRPKKSSPLQSALTGLKRQSKENYLQRQLSFLEAYFSSRLCQYPLVLLV